MPETAIALFREAAQLNKEETIRQGSLLVMPETGNLIVVGDLHGNRENFARIVRFADLDNNPDTHIIFQEIIHGGPEDESGGCLSFQLVMETIKYKMEFPDQVHFIMGNHDTAVIREADVLKGGKEMNRALFSAMEKCYPGKSDMVILTMKQFLFSQAIAAKTHNGIFLSHSLPDDRFVDSFDPEVLNRELTVTDINRPNSVYILTWGRRQSDETLDIMAEKVNCELFILGHQRQEMGYAQLGQRALILASDHEHGCISKISLSEQYTISSLMESVIKIVKL